MSIFINRLWDRLKWQLGKYGLWFQVTQEDLHGGVVEITYASLGVPRRVERYDLGPNVGSHEFDQMMSPLRCGTAAWRSRLRHLATNGPWSPADLRAAGIRR